MNKILTLWFLCINLYMVAQPYKTLPADKTKTSDCNCDAALIGGAQDEFTSNTQYNYKKSLDVLFQHDFTYWESGEWRQSAGVETGGAYLVYSGFFNGSESSEQKRARFQQMKEYYSMHGDIAISDYRYYTQRMHSSVAYNAWVECQKTCATSDAMILTSKVTDNEVIVTLYWKHKNTTDRETVNAILPSNAEPMAMAGGNLRNGMIIHGQSSYSAKFKITDPHKDANIQINVSEYQTDPVVIPGIPLENPSSSYGVPAGTIIAFAGQGAPKGNWVLCNGGILKDSPLYHDLYLAIGTAWGNGDQSAGSFNLPDLRGQFLRGQVGDGIATIDADRDSRINKYPGGTTGNHVGSYELDKVGPHDHKVTITLSTGNDTPGAIPKAQCSNTNYAWPQYGVTDGAGIGKETRPMNAYVAFYIKF